MGRRGKLEGTYQRALGAIVQIAIRGTNQPARLHMFHQAGTHYKGIRQGNYTRQAPGFGEVDGLLKGGGSDVAGGDGAGFGDEEDGVLGLFLREENADFGTK